MSQAQSLDRYPRKGKLQYGSAVTTARRHRYPINQMRVIQPPRNGPSAIAEGGEQLLKAHRTVAFLQHIELARHADASYAAFAPVSEMAESLRQLDLDLWDTRLGLQQALMVHHSVIRHGVVSNVSRQLDLDLLDTRLGLQQARLDLQQALMVHHSVIRHGVVSNASRQLLVEPARPAGWPGARPTLFQRLGRVAVLIVLAGLLSFLAGVASDKSGFYATGLSLSWFGMATFFFANYASARSHEPNWIVGPAVAALSTVACLLLCLTSLLASIGN